MLSSTSGYTTWKSGLGGLPVSEHKLKLSENDTLISTSGNLVLDNYPAGEIEHLTQRITVGKAGLVLGDLAELAVEALNDIDRVYDFLNLLWIFKKST